MTFFFSKVLDCSLIKKKTRVKAGRVVWIYFSFEKLNHALFIEKINVTK